jgi:hypothetical protein
MQRLIRVILVCLFCISLSFAKDKAIETVSVFVAYTGDKAFVEPSLMDSATDLRTAISKNKNFTLASSKEKADLIIVIVSQTTQSKPIIGTPLVNPRVLDRTLGFSIPVPIPLKSTSRSINVKIKVGTYESATWKDSAEKIVKTIEKWLKANNAEVIKKIKT